MITRGGSPNGSRRVARRAAAFILLNGRIRARLGACRAWADFFSIERRFSYGGCDPLCLVGFDRGLDLDPVRRAFWPVSRPRLVVAPGLYRGKTGWWAERGGLSGAVRGNFQEDTRPRDLSKSTGSGAGFVSSDLRFILSEN